MPMLAPGAPRCKPLFGALTIERPFDTLGREQMYAARPTTSRFSSHHPDQALRHLYRWALVLVAALAVMLALSRVAWGGETAATVVVQPGDTLWTIAAERYPGDDTRARIDEIERLNNLSSPMIVVGETLRLPA
jgi:nucleoid-associated protein YgaU